MINDRSEKSERRLKGQQKWTSPPTAPLVYVTYSAIAQKFDHAQGLFDIRDLLFEPTSPLRQVAVHIAVLPTQIIAEGGGDVIEGGER
jgi:hypothetical protein